jgi:hypothetical protein
MAAYILHMTNTNCTECGTRFTRHNRCASTSPEHYDTLCATCYDGGSDDDDTAPAVVTTGRRNMSHAGCGHESTTAARTRCRVLRNLANGA